MLAIRELALLYGDGKRFLRLGRPSFRDESWEIARGMRVHRRDSGKE
jgi:hypothetical protein